jgi:crotonobetainyl-CoA:carnitine CoA-transferase CaiB-like acyl-CoA transferase
LAKISDILIENFKPGDAEKLNIGYNNIKVNFFTKGNK